MTKPAPFGYHAVSSVAEAVDVLATYEGTARVLSGGQSLIPMLNMRLMQPDALVDINRVPGIDRIEEQGDRVTIGAMTRYCQLETSPLVASRLPLLARVLGHVGDRQVRNRGTIGGSLSHGDPTAEVPLACLVLGATVDVHGPAGVRRIPVEELYVDSYATCLDPLEMLVDVEIPVTGTHAAFVECCRRHNDFAVVSAAAVGRQDPDGRWRDVRVGLGGVAPTPIVAAEVGRVLEGSRLADEEIAEASRSVLAVIDPASDIRASAEYRRHLAPVYVERALRSLRAGATT